MMNEESRGLLAGALFSMFSILHWLFSVSLCPLWQEVQAGYSVIKEQHHTKPLHFLVFFAQRGYSLLAAVGL